MSLTRIMGTDLRRAISTATLILLFVAVTCPVGLAQEEADESIYMRFEEVSSLRAQGQYDEAIEILQGIIEHYSQSEEILQRAYTDLVFTLLSKGDDESATASATEALSRFPGLEADPVYFPASVNDLYDRLRGEMFGSLKIATKPDSCRIFLNHDFVGFSPLDLEYVEVGEYILNASKAGYHDQSDPINIEPGSPTSMQIALERQRDKKWWLWRIGPAAIATGVIIALQMRGEEGQPEPSPLPEPPPPPGN